MVLGKLPVPGRPSNLADSRARAYCACSGYGFGFFWTFLLSSIFSPLSPSLWETVRYRLKYCLKGPLNPKQPINQPFFAVFIYNDVLYLPCCLVLHKLLSDYSREENLYHSSIGLI